MKEYLDRLRADLLHLKVEADLIGNDEMDDLIDNLDYHIRRIERTLDKITDLMEG